MKKLILLIALMICAIGYSQQPDRSVTVDAIKFKYVTTAQRDLYVVPATEVWLIWNSTASEFQYNNAGGGWVALSTGGGTDDQIAAEVPFTPYLTITSTDLQAALEELKDELDASSSVTDFLTNVAQDRFIGRISAGSGNSEELTGAQMRSALNVEDGAAADQAASEVPFTPAGGIAASNTQAAIEEVDTEKINLQGLNTVPTLLQILTANAAGLSINPTGDNINLSGGSGAGSITIILDDDTLMASNLSEADIDAGSNAMLTTKGWVNTQLGTYLPIDGSSPMTGTLISQNVVPDGNNTRTLGDLSNFFLRGYLDRLVQYIDGTNYWVTDHAASGGHLLWGYTTTPEGVFTGQYRLNTSGTPTSPLDLVPLGHLDGDNTTYDNTTSGLAATTVRGAIDELEDDVALNSAKVSNVTHTGDVDDASGVLTLKDDIVTESKIDIDEAPTDGHGLIYKSTPAKYTYEPLIFRHPSSDVFNQIMIGTTAAIEAAGLGSETLAIPTDATDNRQGTLSDLTTDLTTGTNKGYWRAPVDGTLVELNVYLQTAGTGTGITVDLNKNGTSVLSTLITTDATENDSDDATTAYVISTTSFSKGDIFTWDFDAVPTGAKGAQWTIYFR